MNIKRNQTGMTLILSMLLILVLSLLAVTAMEGSQFAVKMSVNRLIYEKALSHADSSRRTSVDLIEEYLYQTHSSPTSQIKNVTLDDYGHHLFSSDSTVESGNFDPEITIDSGEIKGSVYVSSRESRMNSVGAGSAQFQGYNGVGNGLGAKGGFVKYYEINSVGISRVPGGNSLEVWTATDFRFIP